MSCKAVLTVALAIMITAPAFAMQTVTAPTNSNGTPRFSDPAAPPSFSSGPGQVTTTFGNGSVTFGTSSNYNWGAGNQAEYGPPVTSPYYKGPSGSGFSEPGFPSPILPNVRPYEGSPFVFAPAPPVTRIDPNKPR